MKYPYKFLFLFSLLLLHSTSGLLRAQDKPIRILYGGIAHESNTFIP